MNTTSIDNAYLKFKELEYYRYLTKYYSIFFLENNLNTLFPEVIKNENKVLTYSNNSQK